MRLQLVCASQGINLEVDGWLVGRLILFIVANLNVSQVCKKKNVQSGDSAGVMAVMMSLCGHMVQYESCKPGLSVTGPLSHLFLRNVSSVSKRDENVSLLLRLSVLVCV